MKIDFDRARALGAYPRVHGNGFLQCDIEPGMRVHIWGHKDLPRQTVDTGIHNHRFDFSSTVIVGRLINAVYANGKDRSYKVYEPRPRDREDTLLQDTGKIKTLSRPSMMMLREGESYFMDAPEWHESFTDRPSATVMAKMGTYDIKPQVLVPIGKEPDNDFNRYDYPREDLWKIIRDVLGYC